MHVVAALVQLIAHASSCSVPHADEAPPTCVPFLLLQRKLKSLIGNYTFLEAYERTGRILNVSVCPADTNEPARLLNYLTAPQVSGPKRAHAPAVLMQASVSPRVSPLLCTALHCGTCCSGSVVMWPLSRTQLQASC